MNDKIIKAKDLSRALGIYRAGNTISDYLFDNLENQTAILAQNITWLRHSVPSYDQKWRRGGYGWNKLSEYTHEIDKEKANKVAMKKIMKLGLAKLNEFGITKKTFFNLQNFEDMLQTYPDLQRMYNKL